MTKQKWKPVNIFFIGFLHIMALYSMFELINSRNFILTFIWTYFVANMAGLGVTAGVHRLWCHKSYKAKKSFRYFLAMCYSIAGQNTIRDWVLDHRVHHKFSDTIADPHNASRGFWFSHVGWLLMKKDPEVIKKGKLIDMTDVDEDPVVIWHTKYFYVLYVLFCFVLPCLPPIFVWNESIKITILSQIFFRYCITLNFTWLVNSAAHQFGNKPFDKNLYPTQNKLVAFLAIGEGWHNYHHVFPYDYKTSELGGGWLNITTLVLDFASKFGLVYDKKEPSTKLIELIAEKRGDGSSRN